MSKDKPAILIGLEHSFQALEKALAAAAERFGADIDQGTVTEAILEKRIENYSEIVKTQRGLACELRPFMSKSAGRRFLAR